MRREDITKGTTERWHCSISLGVQPACEQSFGVGHAYTAIYQHATGGLGLRPSLVVGDALPFSSLPIDNGSGSVSSLCSDAAGTGLLKIDEL